MEHWAELAERAREGDRRAFEDLVETFQRPLVAAAFAMLKDWHLAQDVAQEAFAAAFAQLEDLENARNFRAWLFRIGRNLAVNRWREGSRRPVKYQSHLDTARGRGGLPEADPGLPDGLDPARPSMVALARVRRAVLALPNHYGAMLVMRHAEGMSVKEIGEVMGRSTDSIRSALYRARVLARTMLEKAGLDAQRIIHEM